MPELEKVEIVVVKVANYVSCVQKFLKFFFAKMNTVCRNWKFAFWQTWNVFIQYFFKSEIIGGIVVKALLIESILQVPASVKLATLLFQPIRYECVFSDIYIWIYGLVDERFGSRDVFAGGYYLACCIFNDFNLNTTKSVQNLGLFSFHKVVLIDSWSQNRQNKQTNFPRQAVLFSGGYVPLQYFSQTSCLTVKGICSTLMICGDNLSPYYTKLFHPNFFLGQPVNASWELVPH